jgi:IclR family pca regulon transcriptional regulator
MRRNENGKRQAAPRAQVARHAAGFVKSLARGIAVIRAFAPGEERLTISSISKKVGVSRAAVQRSLITLEELGYVACRQHQYSLCSAILSLGYAYLSSHSLIVYAQPLLHELMSSAKIACGLLLRDGDEMVVVASANTTETFSQERLTLHYRVGSRYPLYTSISGFVFLSQLSANELEEYFRRAGIGTDNSPSGASKKLRAAINQTRKRGYGTSDNDEQHCGLSVPVRNPAGVIVGCVSVAAPVKERTLAEMVSLVLPKMLKVAHELSDRCMADL